MIRELAIHGFKRFAACTLEMAPLTVLTGTNGSGKTSVLHALLLARMASQGEESGVIPLNGPYGLELGTAADVLNIDTVPEGAEIVIHLRGDGLDVRFAFDAHGANAGKRYLAVKSHGAGETPHATFGGGERAFTYLSAERLGPREILRASAQAIEDLGVGFQGEFCAQVLEILGLQVEEKVEMARRHPDRLGENDAFLKYQVEAWLSDVVRPVEINTVSLPNTSVTSLHFRSPGGDFVKAPNMGFGVSYALPIVLAGLMAKAKEESQPAVLIVENPEAHLHPAGQSRIGVFLAQIAGAGVQVILETHSDHVLNGIRRAIAEHQCLPAEAALAHFFDVEDRAEPRLTTLRFTASGGVSEWPRRFFDQYQLDVAALARVRRPQRGRG